MTNPITAFLLVAAIIVFVALFLRHLWLRARVHERWDTLSSPTQQTDDPHPNQQWWLARWLYVSGYRRTNADTLFIVATVLLALAGLTTALGLKYSGVQQLMENSMLVIPGGVGETFLPIVWVAPWLMLILLTAIPTLVVRAARRQRVQLAEQDLPLALELMSTLSEAGLGFDAALTRILRTRLAGRPLADEFRRFQADLLAGRPRTEALRHFSARLDIASVSVFTSAMVQADQLGMGIARVLRLQADDVRAARRGHPRALTQHLTLGLHRARVCPAVCLCVSDCECECKCECECERK